MRGVVRSPFSVLRWCAMILLIASCQANHNGQQTTDNGQRVFRVCADPNNLPYSNSKQQGFENKIADLVARDLGARVEYLWWPQRRGFVRNTLRAGACDCIIGVPSNFELALPTQPYYRSSYVFVSRKDRHLDISSLDDPRLRQMKIGVQVLDDDYAPPARALSRRQLTLNLVGFDAAGEESGEIIRAVARGKIDVAIVWGPQAGFFARQEKVALDLAPVSPQIDLPFLPFVFDISMGVRRGDQPLRDQLDREIERRRADIDRILDQYGVPRV